MKDKGISYESVPCKVYSIMAAGKLLIAAVDEGSDTWKFVQETGCGLLVEPENPEQMAQAILASYQDRRAGEEDRAAGADAGRRVLHAPGGGALI
jgi:hypothetical protein